MTQPTPPLNIGDAPIDTDATQLVTEEGARNVRLASTGDPKPEDDFVQVAGSWRLPPEESNGKS